MSRTDKDSPFKVAYPNGWGTHNYYDNPLGGDSGFRKQRKWYKRSRSKAIRRYVPEIGTNGAKPPYNGLKRTWDFG